MLDLIIYASLLQHCSIPLAGTLPASLGWREREWCVRGFQWTGKYHPHTNSCPSPAPASIFLQRVTAHLSHLLGRASAVSV
jgi:hypothetical protein